MGPGPQPGHRAQLSPDRLVKDTTACPPLPSSCPTCLGQGSPQFWKYHGGHTLLKCVARPVTFYVMELYTPSQVCSHSMFSFPPSLLPSLCVSSLWLCPPHLLPSATPFHPLSFHFASPALSFLLLTPFASNTGEVLCEDLHHAQAWLGQREVPPIPPMGNLEQRWAQPHPGKWTWPAGTHRWPPAISCPMPLSRPFQRLPRTGETGVRGQRPHQHFNEGGWARGPHGTSSPEVS